MFGSALTISRGRALPLGATPDPFGVNFALLCRHGTRLGSCLAPTTLTHLLRNWNLIRNPSHWFSLAHPRRWPSGVISIWLAYRWATRTGPSIRPNDRVLDPLAPQWPAAAVGENKRVESACLFASQLFRGGPRYDWGADVPPRTPPEDSILYELHVRGFTCHQSSGVRHPGTFAGLVDKLSYLKWLASPLLSCCRSTNSMRVTVHLLIRNR